MSHSGGVESKTRGSIKPADLQGLLEAIDEACNSTSLVPVEPGLVRKRGEQLIELSERLRRAHREPARKAAGWIAASASLLVVVALTLPYYVCVTYTALFVDEGFAIWRNPDAQGKTPILEVFQHDFWGTHLKPPEGYITHKSFRPVVTLMYAMEWLLAWKYGYGGREMMPMRAVSCAVHSLNGALVWWLLRTLRLPLIDVFLGAALFATHPVHIENIVYLVGRADALSTTFYLVSVLLYWRWSSRKGIPIWGHLVLACLTAVSGLCKEPGFTTLFFLACVEIVTRFRPKDVAALLISFAILGGVRVWYVGGTDAGFGYVDTPIRYQDLWLTRTLSYLFQHACYAKLLVLPWNQSWDYSYDSLPMVTGFQDLRMQGIVASYLAVAALAAWGFRRRKQDGATILAGLGLVVIPFIPASNLFFLVGTTVGERLLYPCTVGSSILLSALAGHSASGLLGLRRCALWLLLGVYVVNSNIRMGHWQDATTLFLQDAKYWGRSVKVLHAQASELQGKNDLHGALELYLASLRIFDDQAITDYCIARILINLDRLQEAKERFDKILNGHGIGLHDGNDFLWMTDLGYLLVKLGAHDAGVHYLNEGLTRMPHSCFAWNALGVAQARLGKLEEAVQSLSTGLECDPGSVSIWSNLAVISAYAGATDQALFALKKARELNATHPVVEWNVKVLMAQDQQMAGMEPVLDMYIPLPGRR